MTAFYTLDVGGADWSGGPIMGLASIRIAEEYARKLTSMTWYRVTDHTGKTVAQHGNCPPIPPRVKAVMEPANE